MKLMKLLVVMLLTVLLLVVTCLPILAWYDEGGEVTNETVVFNTNPPNCSRVHESHGGSVSMGVSGEHPEEVYSFATDAWGRLTVDPPPPLPPGMAPGNASGHLRVIKQKGVWMNWSYLDVRLPTKHVTGWYEINQDQSVTPSDWRGNGSTPTAFTNVDTLHPCIDISEGLILDFVQPYNYPENMRTGIRDHLFYRQGNFDTRGTDMWPRVLAMAEVVIDIVSDTAGCVGGSGVVESHGKANKTFYCYVPPDNPCQ